MKFNIYPSIDEHIQILRQFFCIAFLCQIRVAPKRRRRVGRPFSKQNYFSSWKFRKKWKIQIFRRMLRRRLWRRLWRRRVRLAMTDWLKDDTRKSALAHPKIFSSQEFFKKKKRNYAKLYLTTLTEIAVHPSIEIVMNNFFYSTKRPSLVLRLNHMIPTGPIAF